ncbi:hypothetical protein BGX27_011498 [Mortierella sp. AM989]|nr:hypothetical protein BGX27_011498 [Mortierella sp. AM989]
MALPISARSSDLNPAVGAIHMSTIGNNSNISSNTGYNMNEHDYDGLLQGSSSVTSASTSTAIGTTAPSENNYSNNYRTSSQETATSNNYVNSNVSSSSSGGGGSGGGGRSSMGTVGAGVPTHDSGLTEGLTRKVTLTSGSTGVSEIKLRRFLEHNHRLREQLEMRRVPVSEASRR